MQDTPRTDIAAEEKKEPSVSFIHTSNFPDLLRRLGLSLVVTTYQANRVFTFCPTGHKLSMLMRAFERPTGLAIGDGRMAMCSMNKIWVFRTLKTVCDLEGQKLPYDISLAPRFAFVTGDILAHELAYHEQDLLVVNTRFSCLSTLSEEYSFIPKWKPPFVSEISAEDRCHLNGMAMDETGPRYLTALAASNEKEGWRPVRAQGGILMSYPGGEIVSREMAMPHSPRLYGGKLWLLNSGIGELQVVDPASGMRNTVTKLPGFLRGLVFADDIAFVGLSRIREKKTFGDLPIESMFAELECGIYAIDIHSGTQLGFIRFTKGIEELFDISVLPGASNPNIVGFEDPMVNGLFILP